jgi:pimeloyl-ACP methyl ester carboxylesterase
MVGPAPKEAAVGGCLGGGGYVTLTNGLRIYLEEHGEGQPLLLLHGGFTSTRLDWKAQVPAWAPHFRVITADARGHGRTLNPGGSLSYEVLAQDVLALIDTLGLRKPFICGHSDGACVALQIAIWAPEVAAAFVLMDAWLWNAKVESRRGLKMIQEWLGIEGPVREQLEEADLQAMQKHRPEVVAELNANHELGFGQDNWRVYLNYAWPAWSGLTEHGADELSRISTPTLVLVGDRDEFQPVTEAVAPYHHLPDAELAVIPGMDHDGRMGNRAELLNQVVLNFLRRHAEVSAGKLA